MPNLHDVHVPPATFRAIRGKCKDSTPFEQRRRLLTKTAREKDVQYQNFKPFDGETACAEAHTDAAEELKDIVSMKD